MFDRADEVGDETGRRKLVKVGTACRAGAIDPLFMTAMRQAMANASSWSWVTMMKVMPTLRFELSQLQRKVGITFIMVTHDQDEALAIASRIAVMNKGSIAQLGTPSDLYEFPASRFVADFIGSVNMFEGTLIDDKPDEATVACPELEPHRVHVPHSVAGQEESPVWVAIRPEKMTLHKNAETPPAVPECPAAHNVARGEIKEISYLGDISIYHVLLDNGRLIRISRPNRSRWDQDEFTWGEKVWVSWGGTSPVVLQS